MIDPGLKPHQCLFHKYVDKNVSAAMLAAKRSAGVTPEVNLSIPLHAVDDLYK